MTSQNFKDLFRSKKITVMGLGLLGRGVGDVRFLAEQGARLLVTDLKSEKELAPSLGKLKKYKNIKYVLGRHRLADFHDRDFILKAAGVPLDSPYIKEAKKQGVPILMSTALFVKLAMAMGVTVVGVTGTRGKSTTTLLLHEILKSVSWRSGPRAWLGGNVRGVSTLALLPKVRSGDIAVLELDSWQLQGFGDLKISPQIAVLTNFLPDHLNYYHGDTKRYWQDKANIFKFQKKGDNLILGWKLKTRVPKSWQIKLFGEHNLKNIACAIAAAEAWGVKKPVIKKAVEGFRGMPGRLELVRSVRGIKIYNDTTATTPDATIAALRALDSRRRKKIILIVGGADKGLLMTKLVREIPKYCKAVILLPGTGTDKIKIQNGQLAAGLAGAVKKAFAAARRGDVILFSPALASFGLFKNEFDRGGRFLRLVKRLK